MSDALSVKAYVDAHVTGLDACKGIPDLIAELNRRRTAQRAHGRCSRALPGASLPELQRQGASLQQEWQKQRPEASYDVTEQVQTQLAALDGLEGAKAYVEGLRDCLEMLSAIRGGEMPYTDAHQTLQQVKSMLKELSRANDAVDRPLHHLLAQLEAALLASEHEYTERHFAGLRSAASEIGWPAPDSELSAAPRCAEFEHTFVELARPLCDTKYGPAPCFSVLASMIEPGFRYHFYSNRPTNDIRRPHWPIKYIVKQVADHEALMRRLGVALDGRVDTMAEFIKSLLPMLSQKLMQMIRQQASVDGTYVSLVVGEVKQFERQMKAAYGFSMRPPFHETLTNDTTVLDGLYSADLAAALDQYTEMLEDPAAFELLEERRRPGESKISRSAKGLRPLLAQTRNDMKLISAPGERRRFIYGIVRRVMEAYYNRLNESYHSFASRVESVVRSVPGTMYGQETSELAGTEGQERFSRLISSCYYAKKLAQEMDDDLYSEVEHPGLETTVMADVVDKFHGLFERTVSLWKEHTQQEISSKLRAYRKIATWNSASAPVSSTVIEAPITPHLATFITYMDTVLQFVQSTLSEPLFIVLMHSSAAEVDAVVWNDVIMRHQFSPRGASQIARDALELVVLFSKYGSPSLVRRWFRRFLNAVPIISIPAVASQGEGGVMLDTLHDLKYALQQHDDGRVHEILDRLDSRATVTEAQAILERRVDYWRS